MKSILPLLFSLLALPMLAQVSAPITAGARGLAMGGSGLNFTDVNALWGNPAGVAALEATSVALFAEQRFLLSDIRQVSAGGAVPFASGTLGLVVGYFGFEDFNEQRIGVVYGRRLSDNIRLGAQLYTLGTRIPDYGNKNVVSFELGMQGSISPRVGFSARMANPMRIETVAGEYLPSLLSLGFSYQPGKQLLIVAEAEKDILFPVRVRVGMEYNLLDALQLRLGIATDPSLLTFGIGYKLKDTWRLDFAAAYHQYLGFTPGIGLVYNQAKRE